MEVGAVDPHAMHDNREPPSEGDLGRLCTASLRDPHRPRAERRAASVMQQDVRRLVEGGSNHLIAATTDTTIVVCLAGAVPPRRQSKMGTNVPSSRAALSRVAPSPVGDVE